MTRLIVVVEGQTEEAFVKDVLGPYLHDSGVYASATIVGKLVAQQRGNRERDGGHFKHWEKDIRYILNGDRSADLRVTTLFDLYGLPDDFPGLGTHGAETDTVRRCGSLETALARVFDDDRFIPYLQRHEFEALVLAALPSLGELFDAEDDLAGLKTLTAELHLTPPEDINDGKATAPSKRLCAHVPGFSKLLHGPPATANAGLDSLRKQCPRFSAWVNRLGMLSALPQAPNDSPLP